jgi:rhodanese-related sulfurtransferase
VEAGFKEEVIMRAQDIEAIQNGTAILLDVRTLEEWNEGHATGSLHIPIDELLAGKLEGLDKSVPIYVYCRSGGRAGRARDFLVKQGYQAVSMGGLEDWVRGGGKLSL